MLFINILLAQTCYSIINFLDPGEPLTCFSSSINYLLLVLSLYQQLSFTLFGHAFKVTRNNLSGKRGMKQKPLALLRYIPQSSFLVVSAVLFWCGHCPEVDAPL